MLAALPDGTSTGGNKRGIYSTDLQRLRANADEVASGEYSTIVGGRNNGAQGDYSTAIGYGANATFYGEKAHSSGSFSTRGDAQERQLIYRGTTTNATVTNLYLDGSSLLAAIPQDGTWTVECLVAARRTDADGESAGYKLYFVMDRSSLASSVALVGTVTVTEIGEDNLAWEITVSADTTNGGPLLGAQGEVGKTIKWVAVAKIVQVIG